MDFRSLRAANRELYLGTTLLVLGACFYALVCKEVPTWQMGLIALAALTATLWGGYFTLLRYQIDAEGVSRSLPGCRILWEELDHAELEEEHRPGTTRMAIHFCARNGTRLTLSSDLLRLEEVEELADELRRHGYLPANPEQNAAEQAPS